MWPPIEFVDNYDEPVQAGFDKYIVKHRTKVKSKKLVTRGIWEQHLVNMSGGVLPPYMERVREDRETHFDFEEMKGGVRWGRSCRGAYCWRKLGW